MPSNGCCGSGRLWGEVQTWGQGGGMTRELEGQRCPQQSYVGAHRQHQVAEFILTSNFQMGKLKLKEVKQVSQGDTARSV